MAKVHPLGVVLVLIVVAVFNVKPLRGAVTYPQVVDIGTFAAADKVCFLKKIYRLQPSPVTFNVVAVRNT